ncbi:PorT family protein [bacterium]|nr:PorT family protein [bacterium]
MKYFFSVFLLLLSVFCNGQKIPEMGILLGKGNYNGELNPTQQFSSDGGGLAFGGVFRYNLNPRYALKATAIYTKIRGNDDIADLEFGQIRNAEFESNLLELSTQIEFNFMKYTIGDWSQPFSPFLFVGLSAFQYDPQTTQDGVDVRSEDIKQWGVAIPFGVGFKVNLFSRFGLSAEWGFRKTGRDNIDGLINNNLELPDFENGKDYDNDWYSIIGVSLNYRLTKKNVCPSNF